MSVSTSLDISNRVHTQDEQPVETIQYAGIAISKTGNGYHIGLLYRDNNIRFMHLAWHLKLLNELPTKEYIWISPPIPEVRARQLAANCRLVWRRNEQNGIPYAFSNPKDLFDKDGRLNLGPTKFGLTCASFVLAVCDITGIQLLNYETWKERPGDREFQAWVVSMLIRDNAEKSAVEAATSEIGLVRYRPCEVAGAAAIAPPPVNFEEAMPLEEFIIRKIDLCNANN